MYKAYVTSNSVRPLHVGYFRLGEAPSSNTRSTRTHQISHSRTKNIGSRLLWNDCKTSGSSASQRDRRRMNMTVHASMRSFKVIVTPGAGSRDARRTMHGDTSDIEVLRRSGSSSVSRFQARRSRSAGSMLKALSVSRMREVGGADV